MAPNETIRSEILSEFLEVAIHNILYLRKLYPRSIFERRKRYGIVVHQSVHPLVNDYISNCMKAVIFHAKLHQLRKVLICIIGKRVYEKHVFDILAFNNTLIDDDDALYVKLEEGLRDYCLRLSTAPFYLNELPDDASFRIILNTTDYSSAEFNENPLYEDFPWVHARDDETNIATPDIVPLHTVEANGFVVQGYIEKMSK